MKKELLKLRKQLQNSVFFKRLKDIEHKLNIGNNSPIIVLFDESDEEVKNKAKELGLTVKEFKEKIDKKEIGIIKIKYV